MLDSINIGMTGLLGYSQALRVISNNTANMNTPGYKSSSLQFSDLFYANNPTGDGGQAQFGYGLGTGGTTLNFQQGTLQATGNSNDLAVQGEGMFVLKTAAGQMVYTRAGQFEFNAAGVFVNSGDGSAVMGLDANGNMEEISLAGLQESAGKATSNVVFNGNLSSTSTSQTVSPVTVDDAVGGQHSLSLQFTADPTNAGTWNVTLMDGTNTVGTSQIVFSNGQPTPATSQMTFTYTPAGGTAQQLTFDFSSNVTSYAAGNLSTLAMTSQDGYAPGSLSSTTFDQTGTLVATYTNGQTVKGARLLLARATTPDAVEELGDNMFGEARGISWETGTAGQGAFGTVQAGDIELSNVDLSQEFSNLVIVQRGYQASSEVISTANDMLQQLFQLKSGQ